MHREYQFYVYIISNFQRTLFYTGICNAMMRRVIEHKYGFGSVFAIKYKLADLMYYESYQYVDRAIAREKEIKKWNKKKKVSLIKSMNPVMRNLSGEVLENVNTLELQEIVADLKQRYGK